MPIFDLTGKIVGGYILHEEIGQGGMAVVYRAIEPAVRREVALKVVQIGAATQNQNFAARFAREAEVVSSLEHIHILPIYNFGIDHEFAFIAMRYLRGGSLRNLVANTPLPLNRGAEIFTQIARALSYAHRRGVIHRDVKPSNILLDDMGNAYLSDFGLAKWLGQTSSLTGTGTVVGTLAYISPEQVLEAPVDRRSDIYSLGIVLYDMLTGRPPFDTSTNNPATVLHKHLNVIPDRPSDRNPVIPPQVDAVVMKALEKNPDRRYQTADDMADALNKAVGRPGSSNFVTPEHSILRGLRLTKLPIVPIAVVALLLALVATSVWVMIRAMGPVFTPATVQAGQVGSPEDMVPSAQEISAAQVRLGADGFIGYLTCNQTSEYHATQAREIQQFAQEYGLKIRIYDSNSDAYKQIAQLERARADGASAFLICLVDAQALESALSSLQQTHLPIAFFNPSDKLYGGVGIGQDEYEVGLAAGRFAGKIIRDEKGGDARVVILDYPDLPSLVRRADGLEAGLKEFAPGATILGRYRGGTVDNGKAAVSGLIARKVAFDVIVSINDAGSFGAIDAMREAGFDPASVVIASIDAEALAQEYIRHGLFMRGSLSVDRQQFSHTGVDVMVKMLAGATLPQNILIKPGVVLTADNLPSTPK